MPSMKGGFPTYRGPDICCFAAPWEKNLQAASRQYHGISLPIVEAGLAAIAEAG
jgi:hypothetical protein